MLEAVVVALDRDETRAARRARGIGTATCAGGLSEARRKETQAETGQREACNAPQEAAATRHARLEIVVMIAGGHSFPLSLRAAVRLIFRQRPSPEY